MTQVQILKAEGLERQDIGSGNCLKVLIVTVFSNHSTELNVKQCSDFWMLKFKDDKENLRLNDKFLILQGLIHTVLCLVRERKSEPRLWMIH